MGSAQCEIKFGTILQTNDLTMELDDKDGSKKSKSTVTICFFNTLTMSVFRI